MEVPDALLGCANTNEHLKVFLSSGNGHHRRLDDTLVNLTRLIRFVNDSLLYDVEISVEEHWWRMMEFTGDAGVVLNPTKLQFFQSTVDFAGFRVTKETVQPLLK